MIASLINMLESLNFGYMTRSAVKFESPEKKFVGDVMDKDYAVVTFISKYFILRKRKVTNFNDIIKVATMFTFKDSKKLKELEKIHTK